MTSERTAIPEAESSGYWPWARPFHIGGDPLSADMDFYPVSVNGREFMVDLTQKAYARRSFQVLRTRQNQQANENLLVEPEVWRSLVESWHLGAGQTRKDRDESSPFRFYSSKNINCWDKWGIGLLNTAALKEAGSFVDLVVAGSSVMVTDGTAVVLWDEDGNRSAGTTPPADQWTTDGTRFYGAGTSDRKVYSFHPATWDGTPAGLTVEATLPQDGVNGVAVVKSLLVAWAGPSLWDISGGVADDSTLIYSHPNPNHTWRSGTDGLATGYILGGQGSRWYVYSLDLRDDSATFSPPIVAAPLPEGEVAWSLGSYLGFVLIGTDKGVRFATPGGDGTLTYGRLIETAAPVLEFEGEDRFVWFGLGGGTRNYREALYQPEAGLGRMDLSTFTAPLTPAFSADLIANDGGDVAGRATSVSTVNGRRVFLVEDVGLFEEAGVAEEGWLEEGTFNQGVRDQKLGLYAHLSSEPLRGTISTEFAYDNQAYERAILMSAPGAITSGNATLKGKRWEGALVRHTLVSDGTASPRLTRFEVRSVPEVGKATEWVLPLIIAEVTNYENLVESRSARDDVEYLVSLVQTGGVFLLREGDRLYEVYGQDYDFRPLMQTHGTRAFSGIFLLTAREVR